MEEHFVFARFLRRVLQFQKRFLEISALRVFTLELRPNFFYPLLDELFRKR